MSKRKSSLKAEKEAADIIIKNLKLQKETASKMVDNYEKLCDELGFDIFPFINLANKNLLAVIDKTLYLFDKNKDKV